MATRAEQSIAFSADELAVLYRLVGRRSLPPLEVDGEDLGPTARNRRLNAACETLVERNVLSDDCRQMATPVWAMLEVLTRPVITVEVVGGDVSARIGLISGAAVEQRTETDRIVLTPFVPSTLRARVAKVAHLTGRAGPKGDADEVVLTELLDGATSLGRPLRQAGVRVAHRPDHGRVAGGELWWIETDEGRWLLPSTMSAFVDPVTSAHPPEVGWSEEPVTSKVQVSPTSVAQLLDAVEGFVVRRDL